MGCELAETSSNVRTSTLSLNLSVFKSKQIINALVKLFISLQLLKAKPKSRNEKVNNNNNSLEDIYLTGVDIFQKGLTT